MSRECPSQQTHPGTTPPHLPASKSNQFIRWSHFQELPYIKVREFDVGTAVCFGASAEHTEDEGLPGKLYVTSSADNFPAKEFTHQQIRGSKSHSGKLLATGAGLGIH